MAKKRVKKVIGKPLNVDQVEKVLGEYSELDTQRDNLINQMEAEIVKIRQKYESKVQSMTDEMIEKYEQLQYFSEMHREDEFDAKGRRSIATVHGNFGFRLGQLKVSQVKGWKVSDSIQELESRELTDFIRITKAIDKSSIIDLAKSDDKRKELAAQLKICGLRIDQDESFFVDIKKEELADA